ncbi:hypothetical protein ACFV23_00185 [Streptomyces sp. NPDC059627]
MCGATSWFDPVGITSTAKDGQHPCPERWSPCASDNRGQSDQPLVKRIRATVRRAAAIS